MALKPCRECAKEVSTEAKTCPHCGTAHPTTAPGYPCPKCGSTRTTRMNAGAILGGSILMAGCAIWIPIIGWALLPFLLIIAAVSAVSALLPSGKARFYCGECSNMFGVPKRELPQS